MPTTHSLRQLRHSARILVGISIFSAAALVPRAICAGETVTIDPSFRVGERLHYSWHLENDLSWSPADKGVDWVKMSTDFDFVLRGRHLLDDGSCIFDLDGKKLESIGESAKGKLGIRATSTEASYLFGNHWTKPGPKTPFEKPMTVTLGPQFQPKASTGIEPIALFLLPGVDPRVWFMVTTAPSTPLTVGSHWDHDFDVEIPGAKGDPLHVVVGIDVVDIETLNGARVITIEARGELNLTDSDLLMKDGTKLHLVHGRYEIHGTAKWDLDRGYLRVAEAEQVFKATCDRPETRRLASKAKSRLVLDKVQ